MCLFSVVLAWKAGGCLARSDAPPRRLTDDDAGSPRFELPDASTEPAVDPSTPDPHALLGVDPAHGPFTGGQTVIVRGKGFGPDARVWFGEAEVDPASAIAVDGGRVQVTVPPGSPGLVAVSVQNGEDASTRRSLIAAYEYDALLVEPESGPTSGGTEVRLIAAAPLFVDGVEVTIGGEPCAIVSRLSETELTCSTPPSAAGARTIQVLSPQGTSVMLLDAFAYGDEDNGFRGGLSGGPLRGELSVRVLDVYTGAFLSSAWVVLGDDISNAVQTGSGGVATLRGPSLEGARTVTVARECYHPITFVDVPVDRVTVYLDPVLSPTCGELGELPATGGNGARQRTVKGELLWTGESAEFRREGFGNVPPPRYPGDALAAYVFEPAQTPDQAFRLPSATLAVTPESVGEHGYSFELSAYPGNLSLYALAGVENRELSPPRFIAYAAGFIRGVRLEPDRDTEQVFIKMDRPLDHAYSFEVTGPTPTPRGPDRLIAHVAVRWAEHEFLVFPASTQSKLLPITAPLRFIGLPALAGPLAGATTVLSARAVTGASEGTPSSTLGLSAAGTAAPEFVEIPVLEAPGRGASWDGRRVAMSLAAGGAPADLVVLEIQSSAGLVNWTIAVPAGVTETNLPDLLALDPSAGLKTGPVTVLVHAARIPGFEYGTLRYRELTERGWTAFAADSYTTRYVGSGG